LSAIAEPLAENEDEGELKVFDVSLVPAEPPDELLYQHKLDFLHSARELLRRGEVIFTLAERDIRAQYKQAVLGIGWALLVPLVNLAILTLIIGHVKGFSLGGGVPTILSTYVALVAFGLFGGAIGGGANALVANKSLMAKSHFPRECFPLSQVLESAFTSLLALVPLFVLFGVTGYGPRLAGLWAPMYIAIEIPFMVGVVLLVSSVIVQMRDLQQIVPILMPLAMLVTVIEVLSQYTNHALHDHFLYGWERILYCVVNPMAPIVNNVRDSVLLGFGPQWGLLGLALVGSLVWLVGGYVVFKKLEVNFADLT